jgi:hypothetical protein
MADQDDSNGRLASHLPTQTPSWKITLDQIRLQTNLFSDESHAPELDWDLLRALVRQQLNESEDRLVQRLIVCFKSWQDAHNKVLTQEFLRRRDDLAR